MILKFSLLNSCLYLHLRLGLRVARRDIKLTISIKFIKCKDNTPLLSFLDSILARYLQFVKISRMKTKKNINKNAHSKL